MVGNLQGRLRRYSLHTPVTPLEIVKKNWSGTFGAYAHFPRHVGSTPKENAMDPQQYLEYAKEWSEQGARIIGGCCGTKPDHIRALRVWLSGS